MFKISLLILCFCFFAVPPTTTVSPATLTINNTDSAMFNCSASGTGPFLFMWTDPSGAILKTGLTPGPNLLALSIPSANFTMHEGVYQCNVTSDQAAEFQRSDTSTGNLTIQGELPGSLTPSGALQAPPKMLLTSTCV